MKRKYLSALLMGTLTVASMSTFTSCKDYDDDISNLQGQIDKLATADQLSQKVAELQSLISSNKSDISSLQTELAKKTTLDEVKAVLANYAEKKYVDDAVATLDAAVKAQGGDITALQAAVKAAQDAADKAATDAKAANEEILKTLETLATKAEVEEVQKAAKAANDAIEALKTGDIKTLQDKQNEILESLKTYAKQESLDKVAAKAEALQTALDKKADTKALTKAEEELNAAITAVKTTAGKNAAAIEGLAATVKNAKDALALAQANQAKLNEVAESLGKGYSKDKTVAAALQVIQAQIGTPDNKLGSLDSRLALIESVLNGVKDDDTKLGLATKVTNIETQLRDIIGEYTTMVTAVDLYKTSESYRWSNGLPDNDLTFIWVPSEHTTKFPANKNLTDAQIEFSADHKNITISDSLVVRVSPTNAELTPANISLINSQGKELNEFVDVQSVKPYKKLITGATRAANATEGNGLWTVTFKLKDGVDIQKFEEATISQNSYVQFAVAVKNTTSEAKESPRRVISAYDVDVKGSSYEPANNNILVQGNDDVWKDISNIRNRFCSWQEYHNGNWNEYIGARSVETGEKVSGINELEWAGKTPYTAEEAANHTQLAKNSDERGYSWRKPLPVTVGKKINIAVGAMLGGNNTPSYYNTQTGRYYAVKGFYVTLDKDFAIESAPSELNAWAKYSYENVGVTNSKGTITKAAHMFYGNEGYITINSLEDTEIKGDIIGFRVYAVNFDGTLVDPDGRAFYVKVGDAKDQQTVAEANATLDATQASQYFWSNGNESNFFANITTDAFNVGADRISDWTVDYTNNPGDLGNRPIKDLSYGNDFLVKLYDKDGNQVNDVNYYGNDDRISGEPVSAKVFLLNPQRFVDGGTYTIKATLSDDVHELRDVTLKFTKVMPTAKDIKALSYVNADLVANNLFSNMDWNSTAIYKFGYNTDGSDYSKAVSREMKDYLKGIVDNHYTLWFENLNVDQSKIAYRDNDGNITNYSYEVNRKNIDGKEHVIGYSYDFGPISCTFDYVHSAWSRPGNYVVPANSNVKMLFNTWLNKQTWAWAENYKPELNWKAGAPVLNQKISASKIAGTNSLLSRFSKDLESLYANGYTRIATKNGQPKVSFSNAAFNVSASYNGTTLDFVFDQTTSTTVPATTGTLTIDVEDCFGQVKVITLGNIKINRE